MDTILIMPCDQLNIRGKFASKFPQKIYVNEARIIILKKRYCKNMETFQKKWLSVTSIAFFFYPCMFAK
jgi:hypothetical protein